MKKFKKIASLVLAASMMIAMPVSVASTTMVAYAATVQGPVTLSVPEDDTHTYEVYQIFTGDYDDTTKKLSNVKWGQNGALPEGAKVGDVVADSVLTDLQSVATSTDDQTKLTKIKSYASLTAENKFGTVSKDASLSVPTGYYLVKDTDKSLDDTNDAYTTYITMVVGDTVIKRKAVKPSSDKTVQDEAGDAEEGATDGYGKSADHDINETFNFKLTATIPADADIAAYSSYPITFSDTMSKGITFENIVSVKVNDNDVKGYTLSDNAKNGLNGEATWTLTTPDLKSYVSADKATTVEVVYAAHLNEDAKINAASGDTTNINTSHIEYNNNPNGKGTGKTPDQPTYVFTFGINNKKVIDTADGQPLKDAGFKLYKEDGATEYALIYDSAKNAYRPVKSNETSEEMKSAENGTFNVIGLDAGTYVLKETTTPAGYNTAADTTIVISATHKDKYVDLSKSENLDNTIIDKTGTNLPTTGGMGTTILYVAGAILVIAGAAVLVIKKRHEA